MKIHLLEPLGVPRALIEELSQPIAARGHEFVYFDEKTTDVEELKRRSAGADVVMIANNPYPAEVVEASKDLKLLNVAFTGIDHVGLAACKAQGVTVCNAANYSNQAVAELVIGQTISLLRKIAAGDAAVRAGKTSAGLVGLEICGRTVGIIGTGKIGSMTAKLFLAFGAKVIAYSNHVSEELAAMGVDYVSLETLMQQSDIVSLHTPNNASTRGMISRELLSMMKPTAIFINCARGPIVDNAALAELLNADKIAAAAIDVFDMEPPIPADYPLISAKNCLLTPHVAFLTAESMVKRAHITFQNVVDFLDGHPQNVCKL